MLKLHGANLTVVKRRSDWVVFIDGAAQAIRDAHYSLYNWAATSSQELDFFGVRGSVVSDFARMHKYFFNRRFAEFMDATDRERYRGKRAWRHFQEKHEAECNAYADAQMAELEKDCETNFGNSFSSLFSLGSIIAERPDDDGKAAWWRHAGA